VTALNKTQLGVLIFPTAPSPPSNLLDLIRPLLDAANASSPSFAQLSKEMCLIMPCEAEGGTTIPRSSKGTIQRGVAYEVFAEEIKRLHGDEGEATNSISETVKEKRSIEEINTFLRDLILAVKGDSGGEATKLDKDTDLFSWGVNSLMATRIRGGIVKVSQNPHV
jgi:hypothetical protein